MCGITGIFAFNSIGRISLVHLENATRCLEKRGPDLQDSWFDDIVGLGHRRLSVIDTTASGNQPMVDSSGRYHIIYNGEVYNYRAIRQKLLQEGYAFRSESDTEVILYAYIHWGVDFLKKLNGFFALAIYDHYEKSMLIARDRFGIKPLVYFQDEDKVLFASEMKSLLAYGLDRVINQEALRLYFQLTYVPAPHTMINGIHKLEPGQCLLIKKKSVVKKKYVDFPFPITSLSGDYEKSSHDLISTLRSAVQDRLAADVPLGAFLSGGIDSSIIVALASEKAKNLKTFSIGFKDHSYFDETHFAELVAEKYQTDHHVFKLTNDDLLESVTNVVDYLDEPFADSSAIPTYILSRETRKHVTVALSGDGADELFSGYNKHSAWQMAMQRDGKASLVQRLGWLWKTLPKSRNNPVTDTFRKLDRFAMLKGLSIKDRYWLLASFIQEDEVNALLLGDAMDGDYKAPYLSLLGTGDINEVLATDTQLVLPGDMLTKVDMMSMANSLEVRVPFLDARVVKAAFSMPGGFKIKGNQRKMILRDAFRNYLPEELYDRPKHGFEVPLLGWFRKELGSTLDEVVFNRDKIESQQLFNWNEIARIKRRLHSFDPGDAAILTWSLYVFQHWYDRYVFR